MEQSVAFTEDLLQACRALGQARVVMRNPVGVVEVFTDLDRIELRDGWAHLCAEPFHVHLHCHAIAQVSFREPDEDAASASRSLWFGDRNGVPLLLVILDRARGEQAAEQARVFDDLRAHHGATRALMSVDELPPRPSMS
jgi:putative heme degradation protein